jgi:hypothetical protein
MPSLIAAGVGDGEGFVALADAAQHGGQVRQVFGDDVDDIAFLLQLAAAGDHAGGQHEAALFFEYRGPEDQVGVAGFVLDGDEQHAPGAPGTLADQDDAGDFQALAVADRWQVGAADDTACVEVCA